MLNPDIKEKILDDLEELDLFQWQKDPDKIIQEMAERYDTPEVVIKKFIADWQAGYE